VPTSTTLTASPDTPVVNETVSLVAIVTSSLGLAAPSGAVTFTNRGEPIDGCSDLSVSPGNQSATAVCRTSFAASTALLSAAFTPAAGSNLMGSASHRLHVDVGQNSSVISLGVSRTARVRASTTYTAAVTPPPGQPGPVVPSGTVEFLDGGEPIPSCLGQGLQNGSATCTVSYPAAGVHSITASYGGDANFSSSTSSPQVLRVGSVRVRVLKGITSTMQWTFAYTAQYTRILSLAVNTAPAGTTVLVKCRGRGCPYAKHATSVVAQSRCRSKGQRACSDPTLNLRRGFRQRRLYAGATITVVISRPGWIGKYYSFAIRARRGPRIQISCIAPGGTRPGVGC
jgi:hypothetical protein